MSDLDGARAKIERAKEHIKNLSSAKTAFLDANPYIATPEFYPEHDRTIFYLDRFVSPPDPIPLIAGDAIHNLRSALDILTFALFRRVDKVDEGAHIYFPICKTVKKYEAQSGRKVEGIAQPDIDAIGLLKPYGGGNDYLWGLHQMDIADKHRLLAMPVIGVGKFGINFDAAFVTREFRGFVRFTNPAAIPARTFWFDISQSRDRLLAFKQGDPIAVVGGNRETYKDVELSFDIAFGEPDVFKGRPVLETLHQLADLVAGIIASFERP